MDIFELMHYAMHMHFLGRIDDDVNETLEFVKSFATVILVPKE